MTDEQKAAYVIGESMVLLGRLLGMHAENMQRSHQGESMAYVYDDFEKVIDSSPVHHNASIGLFHSR